MDLGEDVIEGSYVYRLDGSVLPIEETFTWSGSSWSSQRAASGVSIQVSATLTAAGRVEQALVRWRGDAAVDLEVTRASDEILWARVGADAESQPSASERRFSSDVHIFPLLRCFQGLTVRALAEAGPEGRTVLVPDITDPADPVRLLTARLDVRRATRQDDGTYCYVGGSYEDGAVCEVGDDGLLERYRWDQPGTGLWDVRLRRSGEAPTT